MYACTCMHACVYTCMCVCVYACACACICLRRSAYPCRQRHPVEACVCLFTSMFSMLAMLVCIGYVGLYSLSVFHVCRYSICVYTMYIGLYSMHAYILCMYTMLYLHTMLVCILFIYVYYSVFYVYDYDASLCNSCVCAHVCVCYVRACLRADM